VLLPGLIRLSSEGDALYDVVVLVDAFDPAPEVERVILVLLGKLHDCQFKLDALLGTECLPDFVDEL
jgi:hypothetical protein